MIAASIDTYNDMKEDYFILTFAWLWLIGDELPTVHEEDIYHCIQLVGLFSQYSLFTLLKKDDIATISSNYSIHLPFLTTD